MIDRRVLERQRLTVTGWDVYFVSEGSYATTSALIKAVNHRG
jgi:hypothetical protein